MSNGTRYTALGNQDAKKVKLSKNCILLKLQS